MKKVKKFLMKYFKHKKKEFIMLYLNSKSEEVLNFDSVLNKIING